MSSGLCLLMVLLVLTIILAGSKAITNDGPERFVARIGDVVDDSSRVGKEQKTAMEMAVQHNMIFNYSPSCTKVDLHLKDSLETARATASAIGLIRRKQVHVIIGTLTMQEAALLSTSADNNNTTNKFPLISPSSPALLSPKPMPSHLPILIQMDNDIVFRTQCVAAIVGHFNLQKAIYEHNYNGFPNGSGMTTMLSDSLRSVNNSKIERLRSFPSLSYLSYSKIAISKEFMKLNGKSNKVLIVVQFYLESAALIFEKGKQMSMMEDGYVWIVACKIASLSDSLDFFVKHNNMQGVIDLKNKFCGQHQGFQTTKGQIQKSYGSHYPEEENSSPSIFALRAYGAVTALAKAAIESHGEVLTSKRLFKKFLSTDFRVPSGVIKFKNGTLSQKPNFRIIIVIEKSFIKMAFCSANSGLSGNFFEKNRTKLKEINSGFVRVNGPICWPGGLQTAMKGWTWPDDEKPMKIAIPVNGAYHQSVSPRYDQDRNETFITRFTMNLLEHDLKRLPYQLNYVLVPFYGSYDQMVEKVHNQVLDAAVGGKEGFASSFQYDVFTQRYVSSGVQMVVPVEPDKERWMFMNIFTREMWLQLVFMHLFVCFVVWLIEKHHDENLELKRLGVMHLFCVIFFAQREPLNCNLARLVLAPWLFVILVVTASFTASFTSKLTDPKFKPSVPDIKTLQRVNAKVGCNGSSFVIQYLVETLKFKPQNIKNISSVDDYLEAFANGDIKAAFLAAPQAELFLAKYYKGFIKTGPSHRFGALGVVFPKGSPFAVDISKAILELSGNGKLGDLKDTMLYFFDYSFSLNQGNDRIGPESFSILFAISGGIAGFAFLITFARLASRRLGNRIQVMLMNKRFWRWAYMFLSKSSQIYKFHRSRGRTPNQNRMFDDIGRGSNMIIELEP